MRRPPKPIPISRHHKPETFRIAWSAEPKASVITGTVKVEEKERALRELRAAISQDGYDPNACDIQWTLIEGWGWTAKLKEGALT